MIPTSLAHPLFVSLDSEHTDFCSLEALFISTWVIIPYSLSAAESSGFSHYSHNLSKTNWSDSFRCRERRNWLDVFLVFLGVLTTWILGPFGIEVGHAEVMRVLLMTGLGTPTERFLTGSDGVRHSPIPKKTRRQSRVGSRLSVFSLSLEASLSHIFFPTEDFSAPCLTSMSSGGFSSEAHGLENNAFLVAIFWTVKYGEQGDLWIVCLIDS